MDIERAYRQIRRKCKKCNVKLKEDPAVVKKVEEYRQFWRPQKVKVVLLAESHKYTCKKLLSHRADYSRTKRYTKFLKGCPTEYVKFVYCLGYGENELLKNPVKGNKGTWQFWKILYSCNISKISDKSAFDHILKTASTFDKRISNKVKLLQSLKKKGIWLVDVSITGVDKKERKERELILKNSWQCYTRELLLSLKKKGNGYRFRTKICCIS